MELTVFNLSTSLGCVHVFQSQLYSSDYLKIYLFYAESGSVCNSSEILTTQKNQDWNKDFPVKFAHQILILSHLRQ